MKENGKTIRVIIWINVVMFLLVKLICLIYFLVDRQNFTVQPVLNWLASPLTLKNFFLKPWTSLTGLFLHDEILHFLFNLSIIYILGKIFIYYFYEVQYLGLYLMSGWIAILSQLTAVYIFPSLKETSMNAVATGASASIIATIACLLVYAPQTKIHTPFKFSIPIQILVFSLILINLLIIKKMNMTIALVGQGSAFVFGLIYGVGCSHKKDYLFGFNKFLHKMREAFTIPPYDDDEDNLKNQYRNDKQYNARKHAIQAEIDKILDKINKSGMESLTNEEKETLKRQSKKL